MRKLGDGRIHAAVNCASIGCPPLPPDAMRASSAEQHLDDATRVWASTNAYTIEGNTLYLSEIFNWYGDDFASKGDLPGLDGKAEAAVWFLSEHVSAAEKAKLTGGGLSASGRRTTGD